MFVSRRRQYKEQGQNFLELALIVPLILVLFLGMVEIGFVVHSYIVVANAAREGARFGSRGVHVPLVDITSIVETAMGKNISVDLHGVNANTTIIATQIDLDEDGHYVIYGRRVSGDLDVLSRICEPIDEPCDTGQLNVQNFIDANLSFNSSEELCQETAGCLGDFVVVEVFHSFEEPILSGLLRDIIPYPFSINSTAVMRVLHRRPPS
jgi:hypothetical protein